MGDLVINKRKEALEVWSIGVLSYFWILRGEHTQSNCVVAPTLYIYNYN